MLESSEWSGGQSCPVLMKAAMSHVELAIANLSSRVHLLEQEDRESICALVKQLEGLALVKGQCKQAVHEDGDKQCGALCHKQFLADVLLAAPSPADNPASDSHDCQVLAPHKQSATLDKAPSSNEWIPQGITNQATMQGTRLHQEWLVELMDIFDRFDYHKNAAVETKGWEHTLRTIGIAPQLAENICRLVDVKNSGVIERSAWLDMLENSSENTSPPFQEGTDTINRFREALAEIHAKKGKIDANVSRQRHRFILSPVSPVRVVWDLILVVLLVYIALSLPYALAFVASSGIVHDRLRTVDFIIDMFFVADLILNFRTAYYDQEVLVFDWRRIACNYLKTWFMLDCITCFPVEETTAGYLPDMQPAKLMKIGKVIKVVKLLRLTKMTTACKESDIFTHVMEVAEDRVMSSAYQAFVRVVCLLAVLGVVCHWLACFMVVCGENWSPSDDSDMNYSTAIYWAMSTLTTVGYGDVIPVGTSERLYATVSMVIGGAFYGYMVGMISSTIATKDRNASAYAERMDQVRAWLYYHTDLPKVLRQRIKHHFHKHLQMKAATDDMAIINDLSPALVRDVSFFLIHEHVRHNFLFNNLPNSARAALLPILEQRESEPHDHIVARGDPGRAMFIIIDGFACIDLGHDSQSSNLRHRGSLHLLTGGDSFGEEIILGIEEEYTYSVTAQTPMKMYSIGESCFKEAFNDLPAVKDLILENYMARKQNGRAPSTSVEIPENAEASSRQVSNELSEEAVAIDDTVRWL